MIVPLTYVSPDERDPEPLTPAHLLYERRIASHPHPMLKMTMMNLMTLAMELNQTSIRELMHRH